MLVGLAGVHWPYHVLVLLSCCPWYYGIKMNHDCIFGWLWICFCWISTSWLPCLLCGVKKSWNGISQLCKFCWDFILLLCLTFGTRLVRNWFFVYWIFLVEFFQHFYFVVLAFACNMMAFSAYDDDQQSRVLSVSAMWQISSIGGIHILQRFNCLSWKNK